MNKLWNDYRKWDGLTIGNETRGFNKDLANLQIRPSVQFRFGGTGDANYVELGYALFYDMSKDAKDVFGKSMGHNVYVDYKVSF